MDTSEKLRQYQEALDTFVDRAKNDRWILAIVLVGSLTRETIWRKEGIGLWIVEADGVSRRRKSDGERHRIWRTLVQNDVNLWAELIPRARFKRMVEGAERTSFSYNFFARRTLVYCADESLARWFEEANSLAVRDQANEVLITSCWAAHLLRHTRKLLVVKQDVPRAWQCALEAAHAFAAVHVVRHGEIWEGHAMHRAKELAPEFFEITYSALLFDSSEDAVYTALEKGESWLGAHAEDVMMPVLRFLRNQRRTVSLGELADHFAYSQLYPWHVEEACEYLVLAGLLEKLSAEVLLTKKSRAFVEEPAFFALDV